jgi:hypothetical protein
VGAPVRDHGDARLPPEHAQLVAEEEDPERLALGNLRLADDGVPVLAESERGDLVARVALRVLADVDGAQVEADRRVPVCGRTGFGDRHPHPSR